MKIRSMTATFGKLEKARLEPKECLNIIHAPNEGGKSTWAAFWKAMLYGIDTRDRDKKGYLADKNRYQPWSGAPMEGEMTVEWQGRDITIRRGPRGSTPFGAFSAVYAGTQEPVPGLTAANCGEMLTGVGREVFERSAFLGGGNLTLVSAPELEQRIAALVTSGQEDVSFSQAEARLREWKNKRQVNRSVGEIPKLDAALAQVRADLADLEEVSAQIAALEGELTALSDRQSELQGEQELHRRIARHELNRRCGQASQELEAARGQLTALEQEQAGFGPLPAAELVKQAQGELHYLAVLDEEIAQGEDALKEAEEAYVQAQIKAQDDRFSGMEPEEAALTVRKAETDYAAIQKEIRIFSTLTKAVPLIGILVAALGIVLALGQYRSLLEPAILPWYAVLVIALLFGAINRNSIKNLRLKEEKLLARFSVTTPEELSVLPDEYRARYQAADRAAQQVQTVRAALTDRQARRERSWEDILTFVHSFAPEVNNQFGVSAALSRALSLDHELAAARDRVEERRRRLDDLAAQGGQPFDTLELLPAPSRSPQETAAELARTAAQAEQLSARLNQARGRQRAMGDPAALSARREELEAALDRKRLEFDALTVAMEALTRANARLQERFSPELNALAGQYMARLTGGRYSAVSLTRELEGFVRSGGDVLPRSALYLSRGTADQLYLAVRLAVCRLCLPEKPPILLDDALAAFDDDRMALALDLLEELAGEQQLLLFTCQQREGAALKPASRAARLVL